MTCKRDPYPAPLGWMAAGNQTCLVLSDANDLASGCQPPTRVSGPLTLRTLGIPARAVFAASFQSASA